MRPIIVFILWLILCLCYWLFAKNFCCGPATTETSERIVEPISKIPIKKLSPISFACSSDDPKTDAHWNRYRDSLLNTLGEDKILEIQGFDFNDETNSSKQNTLGLSRAQKVRELLSSVKDGQVRVTSGKMSRNCREEEMYQLIRFKTSRNNVVQVDDRTLIYFPTNSANKLDDGQVEDYLDKVANRVKQSGESVILTGHTDSDGDESANMRLGKSRAEVIKNYLVSKGVNSRKVLTNTKGETEPIAPNNTESGKAKNRRTELIIK